MNDTLFPLPKQLSPRLAWMKKHDVKTFDSRMTYEPEFRWGACIGKIPAVREGEQMESEGRLVWASSEDDAIVKLAKRQGWRLWNEA